jgi:NADH:ubiquinone oxidoreductase subunit F (NADH-binding)
VVLSKPVPIYIRGEYVGLQNLEKAIAEAKAVG